MGSDADLSLGRAYTRTELAFGVDDENVTFQYTSGGSPITGNVLFIGESANNLTLYVDPATGNTTLVNTSTFDAMIDNYQILSAAGSLDPAAWNSLADQALTGWEEANPSANQLVEINFDVELNVASGDTYDLGALFTPGMAEDLLFEFLLVGQTTTLMTGRIVYQLPGDFNNDGTVDGLDFLVWQRGGRNAAELELWRMNYGATSGSLLATTGVVPEPSTVSLIVLAGITFLSRRR